MTDRVEPFDAPDAVTLIAAARTELAGIEARLSGRDRWLMHIAVNALAIASRELVDGPAMAAAHADRLAALGMADEAELAAAIRSGALDDRRAEVGAALWATTLDKLAVANPGYRDDV